MTVRDVKIYNDNKNIEYAKPIRQIYFETKTGNGVLLKVSSHLTRKDITVEDNYLCTQQKNDIKYKIPLSFSGFEFIDFAYFLSKENCSKIFGSGNEYISYLYLNKIETCANPQNDRWILLFNYS